MPADDAALPFDEAPIEPELEIVDPHLHFWEIFPSPGGVKATQRFLLPEALEAIARSGHRVTQSVFVECGAMYRAEGPEALRPVGETEFANGIAAMCASGSYGPRRLAAGIVGNADLALGGEVAPVLEAHIAAGGGRFRGIRSTTVYSEAGMFGRACNPELRHITLNPRFREGARILARMGLSLDVWCFHTQLGELIALADALPALSIVLDHVGTPETLGRYAGRSAEAYAEWKASIVELARRPNVAVKLGGLGMNVGASFGSPARNASSKVLAAEWRARIETCIEAFTPRRCMFISNFPPDAAACGYGVLWNAFKRITASCSASEKAMLFSGTARRVYRLA